VTVYLYIFVCDSLWL